ncbi:f-box-like domain-containing protein [Ditylenchus destructor]|nr:f-box-like domain-containing protein [Ditylenchus destructor]
MQIEQFLHYCQSLTRSKKKTTTNVILLQPNEILKRIFGTLSPRQWLAIRLVCKQFHLVSCDFLKNLTIRRWSPDIDLPLLRIAPKVDHLNLQHIYKLNDANLKQLAQTVPRLKSLNITNLTMRDCSLGLLECFDKMKDLEYLDITVFSATLFAHYPEDELASIQLPSKLQYLALDGVIDGGLMLVWVLGGRINLKGLRLNCSMVIDGLTYLAMPFMDIHSSVDLSFFESLPQLRALEIHTLDNRYIEIKSSQGAPEPEVLFQLLRRCENIQFIALNFRSSDLYPNICKIVDELDEGYQTPHPIVEVQCQDITVKNFKKLKDKRKSYKWIKFVPKISPPAVLQKWQYGSLSKGKPSVFT